MYLDKFLDSTKLDLLYDTYEDDYINSLSEEDFMNVYNVFRTYKFYFMDDIILNYFEIFKMDFKEVESSILKLKEELGEEFVYIIGNDMRYLERIFK